MVLKSRIPAPDWSANDNPDNEALCRKFPLPTHHDTENDPWFHDMEEASHICNGTYSDSVCPFRERCLHISLINNEGSGVFGGLLPVQRKWIRKNVPKAIWHRSALWLHLVPPLEFFKEDDAEEEDNETDGPDGGDGQHPEDADDAAWGHPDAHPEEVAAQPSPN